MKHKTRTAGDVKFGEVFCVDDIVQPIFMAKTYEYQYTSSPFSICYGFYYDNIEPEPTLYFDMTRVYKDTLVFPITEKMAEKYKSEVFFLSNFSWLRQDKPNSFHGRISVYHAGSVFRLFKEYMKYEAKNCGEISCTKMSCLLNRAIEQVIPENNIKYKMYPILNDSMNHKQG